MEERRPVLWYEWLYEVSDRWRVKSFERTIKRNNYITIYERILKPRHSPEWYCIVRLQWWKNKKIHRLVAEAFIPNLNDKRTVNHKDWIRDNNRLDNLEWMTFSENEIHWYRSNWRVSWLLWKKWIECKLSKKVNQYTLNWEFIKQRESL